MATAGYGRQTPSDDAVVSKSLDGIITSWNRGAERIFGYPAAEAIGQLITIVLPVDRQSEEREILTRIRRGERIRPLRDCPATQGRQSHRRFINCFSGQERRKQNCWSIKNNKGYYGAKEKKVRSKSPLWHARLSTEVKTYSPMCKLRSIFLGPIHPNSLNGSLKAESRHSPTSTRYLSNRLIGADLSTSGTGACTLFREETTARAHRRAASLIGA